METIARQVLGNSSKVRATSCIPMIYKCYRDRVMEIMREINPLAVGQRRRGRLHRRIYTSKVSYCVDNNPKGPNFCWHLDGNDKLSPFGFHIHGCIDG